MQTVRESGGALAVQLQRDLERTLGFNAQFGGSFRPDAVEGARAGAPQITRALLLDILWPGWFEVARVLACAAVVTDHGLMEQAIIDGLITDAVDRFAPEATGVLG